MIPTGIDSSRNYVSDCTDYAYAQLSALDSSLCWLLHQVNGSFMGRPCNLSAITWIGASHKLCPVKTLSGHPWG
jgi:hypothetical protein